MYKKYKQEFLEALNQLIDKNYSYVNTKIMRSHLGIESSNRSKINFIWRFLRNLNREEKIKEVSRSTLTYKLPDHKIELS
jgi:hypothetical protein